MKRLADALFTPDHSIILVPLVWISMGLFIADKLNLYEPDYYRIVGVIVIGYWVSVVIGLRFFGRHRSEP